MPARTTIVRMVVAALVSFFGCPAVMALPVLVCGVALLLPTFFLPPLGGAVVLAAFGLTLAIGNYFLENAVTIGVVAFVVCPAASLLLPRPYFVQQFGLLLSSAVAAGLLGGASPSKPFVGVIGVIFALVTARIFGACTTDIWVR